MYLQIICSNCGHKSRKFKYDRYSRIEPADEIVKAGWDSFGSAFYCSKCVNTWEQRNGKGRPLWGTEHTKERVYQEQVGQLLDYVTYLEKGEWPM